MLLLCNKLAGIHVHVFAMVLLAKDTLPNSVAFVLTFLSGHTSILKDTEKKRGTVVEKLLREIDKPRCIVFTIRKVRGIGKMSNLLFDL